MNSQQKLTGGTSHLDLLPFRRGEENRSDARDPGLLAPRRGEDQGEGSRRKTIQRGRKLRQAATWAEKILWQHLRNRKLAGCKFRRQHDVGTYTLDFYCPEARLSIELDGREHGHPERTEKDRQRSAFLESVGIREIRFWNHLVGENIDSVIQTILRELNAQTPHLDPLPFRRGEENGSDARDPGLLAPQRGEKKAATTRSITRKPMLKFVGPRNRV